MKTTSSVVLEVQVCFRERGLEYPTESLRVHLRRVSHLNTISSLILWFGKYSFGLDRKGGLHREHKQNDLSCFWRETRFPSVIETEDSDKYYVCKSFSTRSCFPQLRGRVFYKSLGSLGSYNRELSVRLQNI